MDKRDAGPEHSCRQGRRCKARVRDAEGEWHGVGVERPGSLCRSCEAHAFDAIRQLPDDYDALGASRTEQRSKVSGPFVTGSSERPIPIPLGIDTLMTEINEETARWARRLPGEGSDFTVISSALGTLVDLPPQKITVWVPHPDGGDDIGETVLDGVDAVLRLSRLHERAVSALGLTDATPWLAEHCHVCGLRALTANMRDATIHCRSCRNVWDQDEFARLNNPLVAA